MRALDDRVEDRQHKQQNYHTLVPSLNFTQVDIMRQNQGCDRL